MKIPFLLIALVLSFGGLNLKASSLLTNLVVNGSFESPAGTPGLTGNSIYHLDASINPLGPWKTTESYFEIWANPDPSALAPDGNQHLELLDVASSATISQTITTTIGQTYSFSFQYTGRPGFSNSIVTSINSNNIASFDASIAAGSPWNWQTYSTTFTATNILTTISFTDSNLLSPGNGAHLDNVIVAAVPEPSTYILFGIGAIGMLIVMRWKKNA
jgi:hypothetical protein